LLDIGGKENLYMANFDVTAAFLEPKNNKSLHCWLPAALSPDGISRRVKVLRSLYGEKQAPKLWNDKLNHILILMKFVRCPVEPCLYKYKNSRNEFLIICVHVDDGLMISNSDQLIYDFITMFKTHVKDAVLYNPIKRFINIDISREGNYVYLNQNTYINEMNIYKPHNSTYEVPMPSTINLRKEKPNVLNNSMLPLNGKLRFLADRTRPDILTALGEI
jgi:hypothetical protein